MAARDGQHERKETRSPLHLTPGQATRIINCVRGCNHAIQKHREIGTVAQTGLGMRRGAKTISLITVRRERERIGVLTSPACVRPEVPFHFSKYRLLVHLNNWSYRIIGAQEVQEMKTQKEAIRRPHRLPCFAPPSRLAAKHSRRTCSLTLAQLFGARGAGGTPCIC